MDHWSPMTITMAAQWATHSTSPLKLEVHFQSEIKPYLLQHSLYLLQWSLVFLCNILRTIWCARKWNLHWITVQHTFSFPFKFHRHLQLTCHLLQLYHHSALHLMATQSLLVAPMGTQSPDPSSLVKFLSSQLSPLNLSTLLTFEH